MHGLCETVERFGYFFFEHSVVLAHEELLQLGLDQDVDVLFVDRHVVLF